MLALASCDARMPVSVRGTADITMHACLYPCVALPMLLLPPRPPATTHVRCGTNGVPTTNTASKGFGGPRRQIACTEDEQ